MVKSVVVVAGDGDGEAAATVAAADSTEIHNMYTCIVISQLWMSSHVARS